MKNTNSRIRLGVNIDHAATLRQVRGGETVYPDLLNITDLAVKGGADQITIHLREDRRHIQDKDLEALAESCPVLLNLEMAVTDEMIRKADRAKPDWVCLVPEKRQELTTEGGLNVVKARKQIAKLIDRLQWKGIEISTFIEPNLEQVKASYEVGADAVELHTGRWVRLNGQKKEKEWKRLCDAADCASSLGMSVHAGHGLDFLSTARIRGLPKIEEVNIGHAIICFALEYGLSETVRKFRKILDGKRIV